MTVTNTLVNGNTADAGELNTNFSDVIAATSDGTKDMNINALTCAGAVAFNGNMTLGNATSDTVTFTARVASSVLPSADDTYDLGSAALQWRQLYADDITVNATTLVTDAANGRVGIGTATLESPLTLGENSSDTIPTVRFQSDNTSYDATISTYDQATYGNYIGLGANAILDTSGNIVNLTSASNSALVSAQGVGRIKFYTGTGGSNPSERMSIDENGNVGIGAASPNSTYRLYVKGTSGASDYPFLVVDESSNFVFYTRNNGLCYMPQYSDGTMSISSGAITTSSDERLKKDIVPLYESLDKVLQLKPVTYKWIDSEKGDYTKIGFTAQSVEPYFPELVGQPPKEGGMKGFHYADMVAVLTKAIQELSAKVDEQQTLIESLTSRIEALEAK